MIFCEALSVNDAVAYVPLSMKTRSMPLGAARPLAVASEQGAAAVQLVPTPVVLTKTRRLLTARVIVPVAGVFSALSILYLKESLPVKVAGGVGVALPMAVGSAPVVAP